MLVTDQRSHVRGAAEQDRIWLAAIAACFVLSLAASWQRWSDPVVDVGREMNQPLRLAGGEMLYSDVRHIYGPLSPWLHAALFHVFRPSLTVLYADGIVSAMIALALVYWLGRQIMSPAGAGAATLNVLSFCVLKPAGNYVLPYSYNSLHGAVLGLITLSILVRAVKDEEPSIAASGRRQSRRTLMFLMAGLVAGLATLAKTEMGGPAMIAGVTAAALASYRDMRRAALLASIFLASAVGLAAAVYALVAARVGWSTLGYDSWLLVYTMPPEIAHFNAEISGFAHPLRSVGRMLIALAKVGMLAACIAAAGSIIAASTSRPQERRPFGPADREPAVVSHPWRVLGAVVGLLVLMWLTTGLDRDKGPYLAMPFLLAGFLVMLLSKLRAGPNTHVTALVVMTVFALASLARVILHVRSGGAYASFLLPVTVVIFTYLWVVPFAGSFRDPQVSRVARTICLTLLVLAALVNAVGLAHRYRARNSASISTARGTMIAGPDIALAFNEALSYIDRHTEAEDAVAVMPEGTSINFLSGRRNPLREEIVTPGYLDSTGELRAIRQLSDARTALILIPNRPTREFGPAVFGRDYCQRLMRWIEEHYRICAIFGPDKNDRLEIGDKSYFIRAYCPR